VAATSLWKRLAGLLGSLLAVGGAKAVDLPPDEADAMVHVYDGGGVRASGPVMLVRKKLADRVSVSGQYYVDMVSNASIDVVTTASPYKETRNEFTLGADYTYRDSVITVSGVSSREPDYTANTFNADVTQEVFGGMTTVALGFTRGSDTVRKHGDDTFHDVAHHWRYRLGATQILTPRWLMSANFEAVSDEGFLGSPYRVARVFGAAVPERNPRTRTSRAIKFRALGEVTPGTAVRAEYRYFWDTWAIKAHTLELGASRYVRQAWLVDGLVRFYSQQHALFYSDNALAETVYVSRNRQLGTYKGVSLGGKVTYSMGKLQGRYDVKLMGVYERMRYRFSDFTDIRTGALYSYDANLLQLLVTASF
jgi:hypothetical protein